MKISLIIPAFNEAEGVATTATKLAPVLAELRQNNEVELLFINDGSRDETAALLTEQFKDDPMARVISHPVNMGLGAAIRTGFQNARGDIIITTDFDGTYDFKTIPHLLSMMLTSQSDIVTASPYHPQGEVQGVPGYRLIFSKGASLLYRLLVKWDVYCWTALFRAYRRPVIENISFASNGFLAGTEILVGAIQQGYTVTEFPTILSVRTFGQSSIKIARVTKAHLRYQLHLLSQSILGKGEQQHPVRRLP